MNAAEKMRRDLISIGTHIVKQHSEIDNLKGAIENFKKWHAEDLAGIDALKANLASARDLKGEITQDIISHAKEAERKRCDEVARSWYVHNAGEAINEENVIELLHGIAAIEETSI